MKELKDLFNQLYIEKLTGELSGSISELVYDSRKVTPGCLFVALKGANFDAHDKVREAIDAGARCVVIEEDLKLEPKGSVIVKTDDTRRMLAELSSAYFDFPWTEVKVIGITGTKGKTTCTYLIRDMLERSGHPCGLMGTVETIIGDYHEHALNTTPESYIIQQNLRKMADLGIKYCVMEVSSQAFKMRRVAELDFEVGVLTNLSPDHIGPNEHASYEEYKHCKAELFSQCDLGLYNADDEECANLVHALSTCEDMGYGLSQNAEIRGENVVAKREGDRLCTSFTVDGVPFEIGLPGEFSVYNAISAIAVARHLGVPDDAIGAALKEARVPGRIEPVKTGRDFSVIIDYAHNAMSLKSVLCALRIYEPKRLVCIFGCGGNRDKERRFQMGEVSGEYADFTVITSDNPRFEDPDAIMADIETGITKTSGAYVKIKDRQEAVEYAVKNALPGDVILLAGKGHEDYQEIRGERFHMSERELVEKALCTLL